MIFKSLLDNQIFLRSNLSAIAMTFELLLVIIYKMLRHTLIRRDDKL